MVVYLQQGWGLGALLGFFVLGVFFKRTAGRRYLRIIRLIHRQSTTKDSQLRALENQWRELSGIRGGSFPLRSFLEKFLRRYRLLGMSFRSWDRLAGLCVLVTLLGGPALAAYAYVSGMDYRTVILHGSAGVVLGGAGLLVNVLTDTRGKWENVLAALQEHLESRRDAGTASPSGEGAREVAEPGPAGAGVFSLSADEERLLEEILREYFA